MRHIRSFIAIVLVLTACGPPAEERIKTEAAEVETAAWASFASTKSARETEASKPTHTPRPTSTRDARSDFEKCVESGSGIRYVISGNNVSSVSLTWENDTGGTNQGDYKVPFCQTYRGFKSGDFLYISAQIIRPTSGAGSIECKIYDGNSVIARATASGFASIATCSISAK